MDRRRFLVYAMTWMMGAIYWVPMSLLAVSQGLRREILSNFSNLEAMGNIGKYYLEAYPEHANKKILKDYLFSEYKKNPKFVSIREYLQGRSQLDFKESRTVSVQGWVLSITEARFYALISLWV